jgi:outer membrane lipoprotein SlyB
MKTLTLLAMVMSVVAAAASAADKPAAAASAPKPSAVQGVRLATLCDTCVVVHAVRVDKRKGKASGVGAVGGAVVGGVVGSKATDGGTLGTVGGAAVGGLLGNAIEKRVKRHDVWITSVTQKDGSQRDFEAQADPGWKPGTVLEIGADNQLKQR